MDLAAHPDPGATQAGPAAPFRLTPDLKYVFLSHGHAAAAAALEGAIDTGSRIIAFAGEPGTGKTTLLTRVRNDPRHVDRTVVYCPYPALSIGALLQDFLGAVDGQADPPETVARRIAKRHRGRRLILIVDDATRCPPRLLTDLWSVAETLAKSSSTLQVILAASPTFCQELDRILAGAGMPVAAHVELPPMDVDDVAAYVRHRMAVAGLSGDVFSTDALAEIAQYSLGVARVVNQICSRALMLSDWRRERPISRRLVVEAITDCPIDALVAPHADAKSPVDADAVPAAPVADEAVPPAAAPVSDQPSGQADVAAAPLAAAAESLAVPEPALREGDASAEIVVPAPLHATAALVPEPASAEIDVPAPPSAATRTADPAPGGEASPAAAARPVGRDSLREAVRKRRSSRGEQLRPPSDGTQTPRFSGFVARRSAPPVVRSIASPGPIAPAPLSARRSTWWIWTAAAAVVAAIATAILLQQRELVVRIERALPPGLQGRLTQASEQATAATDAVRRALRSTYRNEPPQS